MPEYRERPLRPPVVVAMSEVTPVTRERALCALTSACCAGCGEPKRMGYALCIMCWRRLHPAIQAQLYRRIGDGFERAYAGALRWLEQTRRKAADGGAVSSEPEVAA